MLMCHAHCGRLSVVTITVDLGGHLAHYPACALHIVEVANTVRQQNQLSVDASPEALMVERDGLIVQMEELVAMVESAGQFTFDEQAMFERWRKRVVELDRRIRRSMKQQPVLDVNTRPELNPPNTSK